jgi:hypothetical protein
MGLGHSRFDSQEVFMKATVYGLASSESQATEILTHLRNLGFTAGELSVLLKEQGDTRNISLKENAVKGAERGGLLGGILGGLAGLSALAIPGIGSFVALGPLLAALGGSAVGGMVGGLAGGARGGLTPLGLNHDIERRLRERLESGDILIAVHSDDPVRRDRAARVFKSSGADEVYFPGERAA